MNEPSSSSTSSVVIGPAPWAVPLHNTVSTRQVPSIGPLSPPPPPSSPGPHPAIVALPRVPITTNAAPSTPIRFAKFIETSRFGTRTFESPLYRPDRVRSVTPLFRVPAPELSWHRPCARWRRGAPSRFRPRSTRITTHRVRSRAGPRVPTRDPRSRTRSCRRFPNHEASGLQVVQFQLCDSGALLSCLSPWSSADASYFRIRPMVMARRRHRHRRRAWSRLQPLLHHLRSRACVQR